MTPWILALTLEPLGTQRLLVVAAVALILTALIRVRHAAEARWTLLQRVRLVIWWGAVATLVLAALNGGLYVLRQFSPDAVLTLEPIWPWPITIAMVAGLLWLVLATYPPRLQHLAPIHQRALLSLRLVTLALLVYAMVRPAIRWTETDKRSTIFALVMDTSRSMNTPDMPGGMTRHESARKVITDQQAVLEELAKIVDLEMYEFDVDFRPVKELSEKAEGPQTTIGAALEAALQQTQSKRLGGVVIASDFAQRALPPHDADPRTVAKRLEELQVPIHTMPFGSPTISGTSMDLIAEDLQVSPTVFVKNKVVVGAKIRALGAAGRELTVRLMVEKPGAHRPGQSAEMELQGVPQKIRPTGNEDLTPVELIYIPEQPGEYKLTLEVVPLEGELVTSNNSLTTFITVLKGGVNVAYFDKVRPEIRSLRRVNESPDIQLDYFDVRVERGEWKLRLEQAWFEPGRYDVYIIGDVPAKVFDQPGFRGSPLELIHRAVERGAGLLMTGGFQNFGAGGYADTPLADSLPVVLRPGDVRFGNDVDPSQQHVEPLHMLPTQPDGLKHFVMRLDTPEKNLTRWKQLPPMEGASKLGVLKAGAIVLAETEDKIPLLVAEEYGQGRSMAFAGDTTFQWFLAGKSDEHQRFWRQVILWLAKKELQGDNSVWLKLHERRFRPSQPVDMTFGARGSDGLPVTDAKFKVDVTGPDGKKQALGVQRSETDYAARFVDARIPGEYTIRVEADQAGTSLGSAQARFVVYEQDLELNNPVADFALAEELSKTTGGTTVPPEQLGSFLKRLISSGLNTEVKRVTSITLWDNWFTLLAFVIILSVEWFYRKSRGLV